MLYPLSYGGGGRKSIRKSIRGPKRLPQSVAAGAGGALQVPIPDTPCELGDTRPAYADLPANRRPKLPAGPGGAAASAWRLVIAHVGDRPGWNWVRNPACSLSVARPMLKSEPSIGRIGGFPRA